MDLIQQERYNRVVNQLNICFSYKGTDVLKDDMEFLYHCFRFYYVRDVLYFYQIGAYRNY